MKRGMALLAGCVLLGACTETTVPDLNNISSETISAGLNRSTVQLLVTGLIARDRTMLGSGYILFAETMSRDLYRIDPSNPSFITQLLGNSVDPGGVIGASAWGGFWVGIRAANNIIDLIPTARDFSAPEK